MQIIRRKCEINLTVQSTLMHRELLPHTESSFLCIYIHVSVPSSSSTEMIFIKNLNREGKPSMSESCFQIYFGICDVPGNTANIMLENIDPWC